MKTSQRIDLPGGCSITTPSVHPANWDQAGASVKSIWYIQYRFFTTEFPKGKQIAVRGMNEHNTLAGRRENTRQILAMELERLKEGFNPITKTYYVERPGEITERSFIIDGLTKGVEKMKVEHNTRLDARSTLKYVTIAVNQLNMQRMQLKELRRKHIERIMEQCEANQNKRAKELAKRTGKPPKLWSNDRHNKYVSFLSMMFKALGGIMDLNPCHGIEKLKTIKRIRVTLSDQEMALVSEKLKEKHYPFWIYLNIFYASGSRITELLNVQGKHVDLYKQQFIRLVKKGKLYEEVATTITDTSLPFWQILMKDCKRDDFVFSDGLVPGAKAIRREQITRRWRLHVKQRMGITADIYSLKHLFTTNMVNQEGLEKAANHNGHKSTAMVRNIYDVNRDARKAKEEKEKHEQLKKVSISFS